MNKVSKVSILALLILFVISSTVMPYKKVKVFIPEAPEIDLMGVNKIAVLDFKATTPGTEEAGKYIADRMIEYFLTEDRGMHPVPGGFFKSHKDGRTLIDGLSTKCFSVVERSRLEAVLAEQTLSDIGLVDDAQAAQIGQLLGVEVMLYGEVSHTKEDKVKKERRTKDKKKYYVNYYTREVVLSASIRVVDTKTGEILGIKRISRKAFDKKYGSKSKLKNDGELAAQCANALAWEFTNMINPWYSYNSFELEKIKTDEFKKDADIAAKAAENLELDKAYAIYKKLYDSDPYNPKFLYNMGVLYEVAGEFSMAQEMFDGAAMLKDEKKYRKASDRIGHRVNLIPFYRGRDMEIIAFDFEGASSNESLTNKRVKVKGSSKERYAIFSEPNSSSSVVVKVPGEVQFEVLETNGDWYLLKLLGGKQGYIHKDNVEV